MTNNVPQQIIEETAEKFIAMLEESKGKGKWIKPFFASNDTPINFESKKPYRGFNTMLLCMVQDLKGYTSNKWGTFDQWKKQGRFVNKGEKATNIIFWKQVRVKVQDNDELETEEIDGERKSMTVPIMRYYSVFNECQLKDYVPEEKTEIPVDEDILTKIDNFRTEYLDRIGACYQEGHGRACYIPELDMIQLPSLSQFNREMLLEYIPTACHETVHWSGATSRLNRDLTGRFGTESYAFEELVADIGAGFISQEFGQPYMFSKNNIAYIESWVKILRDKPKTIITACSLAQKAADYLLKLAEHDE